MGLITLRCLQWEIPNHRLFYTNEVSFIRFLTGCSEFIRKQIQCGESHSFQPSGYWRRCSTLWTGTEVLVKVRQFHWNAEDLRHRGAAAAVWSSSGKEEGFTGSWMQGCWRECEAAVQVFGILVNFSKHRIKPVTRYWGASAGPAANEPGLCPGAGDEPLFMGVALWDF